MSASGQDDPARLPHLRLGRGEGGGDGRTPSERLTGQLLLAMPQMGDPRFTRAVIYICVHDAKGAMGLVLNQPLPGVQLGTLLRHLEIAPDLALPERLENLPVVAGGPVENARGFLLHSPDFNSPDTVHIDETVCVSGTLDSLKKLAAGPVMPEHMTFCLGYAGWGEGQLEKEIAENSWLTAPARTDILFGGKPEEMWNKALAALGIQPAMLSAQAGRA